MKHMVMSCIPTLCDPIESILQRAPLDYRGAEFGQVDPPMHVS